MTRSPTEALSGLLSLAGRTALVTGGAGGIGAAVVRRLTEAGAEVISADLPGRESPDAGGQIPCDMSQPDQIRRMIEQIEHRWHALHVVVHCAGLTRDAVLWKMTPAQWSEVIQVNLESAFHLLKGSAPLMRKAGHGSIVLVASINGERGKFGQANYAASKAGLIGLGKTAARELGGFGVRVNCVAPGLIESPMTRDLPEEARRRAAEESALGRIGEPDDVARAALFLCSDMSRHVTGQTLRVDGGQLIA